MKLTIDHLMKISPGTPRERHLSFLSHLNAFMPKYGIDTPVEIASFLAQLMHESGGFKYLREIWGPTKAQSRYEGRLDLGNTEKGDGKRFMGRGLIQLTGRNNYKRMSIDMFGDDRLLRNPEILATPEYGVWSACIYWKWRKMDAIDDDLSIKAETIRVNGGYNGLDDRQKYFDRAIKTLT